MFLSSLNTDRSSPNFDNRAGGCDPSMILIHYTGMETGQAAFDRLCDPEAKVSAHYFIDEKGVVSQMVADEHRAWHAGVAYWDGELDINSASIGIELVNPGHEFGYCAFPEAQMDTLKVLCKFLINKYKISLNRILAHSDVAPERKVDPGELFPWQEFAAEGIGIWSAPQDMDIQAAQDVLSGDGAFRALLTVFGYDPGVDDDAVFTAFYRHFYPEKILNNNDLTPDALAVARLLSLIRVKHDS